ncbi:MAG: GspH/FimT family protein [Planctomycetota bacterium]
MRPISRHSGKGFTLIELVLVMIIVAVIAAIAAPRFAQANARQQIDAAARRIANDLEKAQRQARASSNTAAIKFTTNQDNYTFTPAVGTGFVVELGEPPYQVEITKVSFGGPNTVTFNGFGIPTASGTITIGSAAGQSTITLDETGAVLR